MNRRSRKLLVASIGVATMSYVAYSCASSSGNGDASADAVTDQMTVHDAPVANLAVPPDVMMDAAPDSQTVDDMPVANLAIPPG